MAKSCKGLTFPCYKPLMSPRSFFSSSHNYTMSNTAVSHDPTLSRTSEHRPLLTELATSELVRILQGYSVALPKCQDEGDFHLTTVRLDDALEVCLPFLSLIF